MTRIDYSTQCFTLAHVYDHDACLAFIDQCESIGFTDAPVTTNTGPVMMQHIRNNERVMVDDLVQARKIFELILPQIPSYWRRFDSFGKTYEICGLNERLRFYRYDPGHRFKPHRDGCFRRDDGSERSFLTVLIYLNDAFMGGETRIFDEEILDIEPATGLALFFKHDLMHEGCAVDVGRKYVLRTDVMYRVVESLFSGD